MVLIGLVLIVYDLVTLFKFFFAKLLKRFVKVQSSVILATN